jgi:hypothetical protein
MAVFAVDEFTTSPAGPDQYDEYYDLALDARFLQLQPQSLQSSALTVGPVAGNASRVDNVVTLTLTTSHQLIVGEKVIVTVVDDSTFNGTFYLSAVTGTTVSYGQEAGDTTSQNGTVTPAYPEWTEISTGREIREDVRINDTLVRSKYAGRDYQTFLDEGLSFIRERFGDQFNDFVAADFGIMFFKYVASALDTLSWYLDKESTEFFWGILRLRSRAEQLSRFLAYKPRPATACSADLNLTLDEGPYAFDVLVAEKFKFQGPSDLVFELLQDVIFSAGETTKTVIPSVQGETIEENFVATGEKNLVLQLQNVPDENFVANNTVEVFVDGTAWTIEDFLPFTRTNSFEVQYGTDPPQVTFGDGVVGNIPDEGLDILVRYVATRGKAGLAAVSGSIENPVDPLVQAFQVIPITANNPDGAAGGDDFEILEEVKANAPPYFKTADRGVTELDLTTLASQFAGITGSVSKARANIVRGIEDDLVLQGHLDDIEADADAIEASTAAIDVSVTSIGTSRVSADTHADTISTKKTAIDTEVTSLKSNLDDAEAQIEVSKGLLQRLPYQQKVADGDGASTVFSSLQLDKYPVAEGTVVVYLDALTVEDSGSDGDLDTSSGTMSAASATFDSTHLGRLIQIGSEQRQITQVISGTVVRYSGSALSGTTVEWQLFDPAVQAVDDGAGGFTGTGFVGGGTAINYTTGVLSLQFTKAPDGNADFGVSVLAQWGYEDTSVAAFLDLAIADIGEADTDADDITALATEIQAEVDAITGTDLPAIATEETSITTQTVALNAVPASIDANVATLTEYLDTNLSGECKANIVIVQAIVVDENGFYARPTQALLDELQTELDTKNVVPTTVVTVSGFRNVLAVDFSVQVKISSSFKYDDWVSRATVVLDNLLRGREYGVSMFRSDYYNRLVPDPDTGLGGVEGATYANIAISGTDFPDPANEETPPSVDSDGNLVITTQQVLTKGTYTFTEIT